MQRPILLAVIVAGLLGADVARAQGGSDGEEIRYSFYRTDEGYLRLEARTGQVSLCSRRPTGWQCQSLPDERAAFDAEIARLQAENVALKKELLSHNLPLPGVVRPDVPPSKPQTGLRTPSDDVSKVMSLIGQVWRRLVEMIANVQKDLLKRT